MVDIDAISQTTITSSQSAEEESEYYLKLKCKCGKCTIIQYLELGEDCPRKKCTPQLILRHQKPAVSQESTKRYMAYTKFKSIINRKAASVNTEYVTLLGKTISEIEDRYSLVEAIDALERLINAKISSCSSYSSMYNTKKLQLRKVKNYAALKNFLEELCCWFNIDVITHLRTVLLFQDKDNAISAYQELQTNYMKRCCILHKQCDDRNQPLYIHWNHLWVCMYRLSKNQKKTNTKFEGQVRSIHHNPKI